MLTPKSRLLPLLVTLSAFGCGQGDRPAPATPDSAARPEIPTPAAEGRTTDQSVPAIQAGDPPTPAAPQAETPSTPVAPPRPADPAPARPHYYNRVVAVCIGIQDYEHARVGIAADADKDAESMADLFANTFGFEVVKLVGKDATRKRILGEIDKYTAALGDRDALIVFFAGHGQVIDKPSYDRAGYLVPYDADLDLKADRNPDDWERKSVNMGDLCESTAAAKAQHVLFVVNACCSGFMANRGGRLADRPDNLQLMTRRSRIVVAATTENQNAVGGSGSRFGPFAPAFRARLSKGEAVSVTEVFVPLREQVVRDSKGAMLPQLGRFGIDDGEFVFIPKSFTANEVKTALTSIEAEAKKLAAQWTKPEHLHDLLDPPNYKGSPKRDDLDKVWQARLARFRTNAGLGDPLALTALAVCYHRGFGVDKPDPSQAAVYAQRAMDTKRAEGKFARGVTLLDGPERSELKARDLLKASAEEGFLLANVVLADQLLVGKPTAADLKRAEELLDKA